MQFGLKLLPDNNLKQPSSWKTGYILNTIFAFVLILRPEALFERGTNYV